MATLKNKTIVITRKAEQAKGIIKAIQDLGGNPLLFPTIATRPTEKIKERDRALSGVSAYHWIIFSSENAAKYFLAQVSDEILQGKFPKVAAVGSKTAKTLQNAGLYVDVIPAEYTAKGLLNVFSCLGILNQRFLLPVSNIARNELPEGLQALGAKVNSVEFYRTIPNPDFEKAKFLRLLQKNAFDVLTFFSPSEFRYLIQLAGEEVVGLIKNSPIALAAIGPTTAKAISEHELNVAIQPQVSDSVHLLKAMEDFFEWK